MNLAAARCVLRETGQEFLQLLVGCLLLADTRPRQELVAHAVDVVRINNLVAEGTRHQIGLLRDEENLVLLRLGDDALSREPIGQVVAQVLLEQRREGGGIGMAVDPTGDGVPRGVDSDIGQVWLFSQGTDR